MGKIKQMMIDQEESTQVEFDGQFSSMNTKNMYQELLIFLGITDSSKFINNTYNYVPDYSHPEDWIRSAFVWMYTEEGNNFWANINEKWQEYLRSAKQGTKVCTPMEYDQEESNQLDLSESTKVCEPTDNGLDALLKSRSVYGS